MSKLTLALVIAAVATTSQAGSAAPMQLAQVPAQMPAPTQSAPEWQRPNVAVAEYTQGAKRDIDAIANQLADARQRANESGQQDRLRKLNRVEQNLGATREQWEKLPQTNQANWDTVKKNFELAYEDLRRSWEEANRM